MKTDLTLEELHELERDELEKHTLMIVSSDLYYDLADNIDNVTDEELIRIIACNGDFKKELRI